MRRKNMMRRSLTQTIRRSLGRYLAIFAIVALGAGLFCGLRVTKVDMVATLQRYTDDQNMFDLQLLSSYGWTQENVDAIASDPRVASAEGGISLDALVRLGEGDDTPFKLLSLPTLVNRVSLTAGRLPQAPNECLLDGFFYGAQFLGQEVTISSSNEDSTLEMLAHDTYTVVGLVNTPLYLNMQRGSTSIGSGSIGGFALLPLDGFSLEYFTEINLTLPGNYAVYSDAYNNALDDAAQALNPLAEAQAQLRFERILAEAEEEYAKGRQEYLDGLAQFHEGKWEADAELSSAYQELSDAQAEIEENEQKLADGRLQIKQAQKTIDHNRYILSQGRKEFETKKQETYAQLDDAQAILDASYPTVSASYNQLTAELAQVEQELAQINAVLDPMDSQLADLNRQITQIDTELAQITISLPALDSSIQMTQRTLELAQRFPATDPEDLAQLEQTLAELTAQRDQMSDRQQTLPDARDALVSQRTELQAQREELTPQRAILSAKQVELQASKALLDPVMETLEETKAQLEAGRAEADAQFAAAEQQLLDGERQLNTAQNTLNLELQNLEEGEILLAEGKQALEDGWKDYHEGKQEADRQISEAMAELNDARFALYDARHDIDHLEPATVYTLDRNTNLGYVVFESDSDIVAGVAKIFPLFFLAVAALVVITTMTRMIDEERTQIGILKALGYSYGAIMGKFLAYSGSATLLGCLGGLALGSTFFPMVIWYAYCIMYDFSDMLTLSYDPFSIFFIFASYLGLTLLVTWNCCRRELQNVPAELIRPKPPVSGKQIFLEKLPLWRHLKFLDKVALRNIFRYRQRLAMMLLGIGGCTALLVTGFGLKDSVSDIVSYQFQQVTVFDIGLTFDEPLDGDTQALFRQTYPGQGVHFCYQGGIDLDYDNKVKNVYFLATDESLDGFLDLHTGDTPLSMPRNGQALISVGAAESMGIQVGDTVLLRNPDHEELTVTVSGIFDNHVNNYAIVSGDTLRTQWGRSPQIQSAFITADDTQDRHQLGTELAGFDGVISVTVNQDTADTVGGMMDALDMVILLVVVCAGALAGIVLYNLTNINIQERIREIATIKVLGFHAAETASYVFKENLTLTFVAALLGLGAGKWLHAVVMSYVRIDMVWFDNRIKAVSYLLSFLLTVLSAIAVDFIMYFRLNKINMAEALKSVE